MRGFFAIIFTIILVSCQAAPVPPPVRPATVNNAPPTVTVTPVPQTVLATPGNLYAGPGNSGYEVVAQPAAGDTVIPLGYYGDFVKVETAENLQGYLWKDLLQELPAGLPEILPADIPGQTLDLLPLAQNQRLTREDGKVILDNIPFDEWYGMDFGPLPVTAPFSITLQAGLEGEFAGILLYGSYPETGKEMRPIMIIEPNGHILFQDGITYDSTEISISMPADGRLVFNFLDPQGATFDIKDGSGGTLKTINVPTDIPNLHDSQGLFPYGQIFFGLQTSPGSRLILTELSLNQVPDGRYNPLAERPCSLLIGEPEIVVSRDDLKASGLFYWPDTVMGILRAGEAYTFIAGNSKDIGIATGTLDNPLAGSTSPNLILQEPKQHFDYASGGPVYRDPSGMLLMVYHAEIWQEGITDGFVSSLGMARSEDNGASWYDLGIIITPNLSEYMNYATDVASGPTIVRDDYFYIYFRDALKAGDGRFDVNMAVARAKTSDVISAARVGDTAAWSKYYRNAWDEPGLGGRSSPLETGNPGTSVFDVKYNEYMGRYVAIGTTDESGNLNLYYIDSLDGLYWSQRQPVDLAESDELYPTLVGRGENPQVLDDDYYVYYVKTDEWYSDKRWDDAILGRKNISCDNPIP